MLNAKKKSYSSGNVSLRECTRKKLYRKKGNFTSFVLVLFVGLIVIVIALMAALWTFVSMLN